MRKLRSLFFILLIVFYCSCKRPEAFVYKDLRNIRLSSWSSEKSRVTMDLIFYNPNNYGVELKKVDGDIYIDSNYAGKFLLDTIMHIPKNAEFTLPASLDVNMKTIFKNAFNVLTGNEVLISAKGTSRVGKKGFFVTVPFEYTGKQKLNLF